MNDLPKLALSVRQPWASAIVHGVKDIENRDWSTETRGFVCIHASRWTHKNFAEDTNDFWSLVSDRRITAELPKINNEHFGAIIGVAEIVDCVRRSSSPWFVGRYGFVLAKAMPVDPIPVNGQLGFFDWRDRVIHRSGSVAAKAPSTGQGSLL